MISKRAILRVQLDLASKRRLEVFCEQRGMTQIAVMSRLVDWFVEQNEVIQLAVMRLLSPELAIPLARQILEQAPARRVDQPDLLADGRA